MNKKWYHSKTLWVNTVAGIAVVVQALTGEEWVDAELQAAIVVVVNFVLRLITKQGLGK